MSGSADYNTGLRAAHALLSALHKRLGKELGDTPRTFFGRPSARHHEIEGASKALVELSGMLVEAGGWKLIAGD